jgi:hypothetical protein
LYPFPSALGNLHVPRCTSETGCFEISLAYASDDIAVSTGAGTTSFEEGDTGGWQVPGAPPPGTFNLNDWFVGTAADRPPPFGATIHATLERQGEIVAFLESIAGEYPFRDLGAIVHDHPAVFFALENQTRPTYHGQSFGFFDGGATLVVHELAHQWFGDRVLVNGWQHIWLNEGFASYMEWLAGLGRGRALEGPRREELGGAHPARRGRAQKTAALRRAGRGGGGARRRGRRDRQLAACLRRPQDLEAHRRPRRGARAHRVSARRSGFPDGVSGMASTVTRRRGSL